MKKDKQGIVHLSEAEIVERGWTKAGVTKFLGDPDWRPSFRAYGQTMQWRLYQEDRVLAMELTDDWKIWRVKSEKRRESARVRALAKIAEREAEERREQEEEQVLIEEYKKEIESIAIRFNKRNLPSLEKLRVLGESNWVPSPNPDPSFSETKEEHSDRVTVNYLRHHLTNYDDVLYEYNINDEGYPIISRKVHALIAKRFPELQDSCDQRVAYSSSRSFGFHGRSDFYRDGYHDDERLPLSSPEMQKKRSITMVSLEEQKRLGLI